MSGSLLNETKIAEVYMAAFMLYYQRHLMAACWLDSLQREGCSSIVSRLFIEIELMVHLLYWTIGALTENTQRTADTL